MDKKTGIFIGMALTFVVAVCWKNDFIRFLLGFEILVLLAAWMELIFYRGNVKAILSLPHTVVYRGEQFPVHIKGTNQALLPVSVMRVGLQIHDRWADRNLITSGNMMLDSKMSGWLNMSFEPGYCGVYEVSLTSLTVWDHLGIFKLKSKLTEHERTIYVLPEAVSHGSMDSLLGDEESDGDQAEFRKGRSAVDTADIREYRIGDSIRHIHWKLSAKEMKLMVREIGEPIEKMNRIYLNLQYQDKLERDDWEIFLDNVARLSSNMLEGQRPHYVCWIDTQVRSLVEYKVTDPASQQDMMCGLLFARAWKAGEMTDVLEEIRWDETMEENIELSLGGEIVSAGAHG